MEKHTQESYTVAVPEIQPERIFLQHVTKSTGETFVVVEEIIQETFLPCRFFRRSKNISPIIGNLSRMTAKKYGLGLLNPVMSADKYLLSLQRANTELIQAVTGEGAFSNADHLLALREEMCNR